MKKIVSIFHKETGELIAEGPLGWGIMPFEGNYYIQKRYLKTKGFKNTWFPGLCIYKFFYVWLNFQRKDGDVDKMLGWLYFLPNPLFPFIWFRVALPGHHEALRIDVTEII